MTPQQGPFDAFSTKYDTNSKSKTPLMHLVPIKCLVSKLAVAEWLACLPHL